MDSDANKAVVQRFVEEVCNRHDTSTIAEVLADDFRVPPGDDGLDRDRWAAVLSYYFGAFSDLHYEIEDIVAEGDTVVTRVTMSGTQDGECYGQAPTGRRVQVDEVDVFQVVDGRITSQRIVWDELNFRRQLGLPLN